MSTSTDRYGIGIGSKPAVTIRTADSQPDVAREFCDLLVDVDEDTSWTVLDLIIGDQIGGTLDGSHGTRTAPTRTGGMTNWTTPARPRRPRPDRHPHE